MKDKENIKEQEEKREWPEELGYTPEEWAQEFDDAPEGTSYVFTDEKETGDQPAVKGYQGIDYSFLFPDEASGEEWLKSGEQETFAIKESKMKIKKSQIKQAIMEMLSEQSERRPPTKLEMNLMKLLSEYTVTGIYDENVDYKQLFWGLKKKLESIVDMSLGDE